MTVSRVYQESSIDLVTFASAASNGGAAKIAQVGPFGRDGRIKAFYWTPTGADSDATATGSYRQLTVRNGGTAGTGTAILASVNITASLASLKPSAGTLVYPATATNAVSGTFASGEVLVFSQGTVGAAETNATVLRAGQMRLVVEFIG